MDLDDHGRDLNGAAGNARNRIMVALDDMSFDSVKDLVVILETNGRDSYQGLHFDVFRSGNSTRWNWEIGDTCPLENARAHAPSIPSHRSSSEMDRSTRVLEGDNGPS